ncbi:YNFM family putative membrane transporter [Ureibacillus xyleni]|uniref:YNFM family putative membrane transporter n=1 Tax=Ureibacillus xyleni TaxID=614648 RepID=A0A285SWI1_9BACL|nr:MFS transporter [Ureibacillus xyleni]SOC12577.1 YNFM family putative membrane transporter [Ureibacillus xyleni]
MFTKGYEIKDKQFWRVVVSLGLASMFTFAAFYSFQPLLPVLTEEYSITVSYSSMSMSVTTVSLIIGLIVLGFLSDRNGRVLFIKLSIFLSILPFLIIPFIDSYLLIVVLRFIQGFTLAGVPAAALAYIGEEIDSKYSSLATALYISTNALGGMIGRIVAGFVAERYNWQLSLSFIVIFGAIVLIIVLLALPKSKNFNSKNRSFKEDLIGFSYHLRNPSLLLMFGLGIVLQITFTGTWTYLPFHLTSPPFSLSLEAVSLIYFAYGFGILGAPIASWLSNRFALEKIRVVAICILIIGVACTLHSSLVVVLIGLCILCFGFFTAHSLTAASVSRTATHLKGSASSLYLVAYYIGVASGSTLIGPLWDMWKWNGIIYFTVSLPLIYLIFLQFTLNLLDKKGEVPS